MIDKFYNSLYRSIKKMSVWNVLLLLLGIIFVLLIVHKRSFPQIEGFSQQEKFVVKKGTDIYDDFYADIYDDLFYKEIRNTYEVGSIINKTGPDSESLILDIGSGTGHIVDTFNNRGYKAVGLDKSKSMIEFAQDEYPNNEYVHGDALNAMIFPPESFTHITCLDFTMYYIQDKRAFFDNCYRWLMPGGYMIIHLVNRQMFDPIVPAGKPLLLVSPQSHAKERITNSSVKFNNFQYMSDFQVFPNDFAQFKEVFTDDKTGKVRQNIHEYYMPTQKYILSQAKDVGFIMLAIIDLVKSQDEYQYLYVLQKPS